MDRVAPLRIRKLPLPWTPVSEGGTPVVLFKHSRVTRIFSKESVKPYKSAVFILFCRISGKTHRGEMVFLIEILNITIHVLTIEWKGYKYGIVC